MIKTFKFPMAPLNFNEKGDAVIGQIPAGRILKAEPIFEDGRSLYLIEVDTTPSLPAFTEHYRSQ